jgi:group I intron endonuclease
VICSGIYFDAKVNESRPYLVDTDHNRAFAAMPKGCGIYAFSGSKPINEERVLYVGKARHLRTRLNEHFRDIRVGEHPNGIVQKTVTKYGEADYTLFVLEPCQPEELLQREQNWLDYYNDRYPKALMNIATKSDKTTAGYKHTDAAKAKVSAAHKGHSVSAATRAKISAANKGKKFALGLKRSALTKARMSEAQKWRYKSVTLTNIKTGETVHVEGISVFARARGIDPSKLCAVARGDRLTCKGWRLASV